MPLINDTFKLPAGRKNGQIMYPCTMVCDWSDMTADSIADSPSPLRSPGSIASSTRKLFSILGVGTYMLLRFKYAYASVSALTGPTIQAWGKDGNGLWNLLKDRNGNKAILLPADLDFDVQDGSVYAFTDPVAIDLEGSSSVLVTVHTAPAFTGGSSTGSLIQGKAL